MRGSYDFETWEWVNPLCCGLMWGDSVTGFKHEFLHDTTARRPRELAVETLLRMYNHSEVSEWWAHNGGKFDSLYLSSAASTLGWEQEAILGGGGRAVEWIYRPKGSSHAVRVYDSQAIIQSSLARAAKDFHLPSAKLFNEDDYSTDTRTWAVDRLRDGCLIDCRIVLELLETVEALVVKWGGKLKRTFSSTALTIIKHNLKSEGRKLPDFRGIESINATARQAYYGARVEVFRHTPTEELTEYDICSSYPYAMTRTLPWEPDQTVMGKEARYVYKQGMEGIFHAEVDIPAMAYPPLPYRIPCKSCIKSNSLECHHKRPSSVYFPTGKYTAWFTGNELRYAEACGVRVAILEGITYSAEQPFKKFINDVYETKRTAPKGALRELSKCVLNGSYGKFGQKPENQTLRIFSTTQEAKRYAFDNPEKCTPLGDESNALAVDDIRWPLHTNYALAAYITAEARINLHKYITAAQGVAYSDSDSIHCIRDTMPTQFIGDNLGQLKVEIAVCKGRYYAPKIYRLEEASGQLHFASKGFPIGLTAKEKADIKRKVEQYCTTPEASEKLTKEFTYRVQDEKFNIVINREFLTVERMQIAKTQIRKGNKNVERLTNKKVWKGISNKRRPLDNGNTVAWSVNELREGAHKIAESPGIHRYQYGFPWTAS